MFDSFRRFVAPLLVVTAIASLIAVAPAYAGPTDRQREIDAQKAELRAKIKAAEQQAKDLKAQIAASDARRAALERDIASLNGQLADAEQRLAQAETLLGQARNELLSLETSVAASSARLELLRQRLGGRARTAYMNGTGPLWEILISARSLRDFLSRAVLVKNVLDDDKDRLTAVEDMTGRLTEARGKAQQHKTDVEAQKAAIEQEKRNVADLRSQVRGKREAVVGEIDSRKGMLVGVQGEKAKWLQEVARLEAESRSITALLRNRQRGQVVQAGSGRSLAWPTTGRVTSGFGYRRHPIFGDERFHTGIDIDGSSGQPVIAADAGDVIFVGTKSGYGLMVLIDHGNAFATLYAHLSSTAVGPGARVARGAKVGGVGCTGYCTGPHLHFETRVNGNP
ncbi:MAG: peptidoglycan DD-metalloendopeptidase family protein, partial [Acidobacteria bacterium]|nr:peptidoglycan DD-metalloendopeptidase family protein [Acidobacteriota bacterium]